MEKFPDTNDVIQYLERDQKPQKVVVKKKTTIYQRSLMQEACKNEMKLKSNSR
jgi:hypothetical protein